MNPIGQAFPVINRAYAFSSYFDQPPQLLNVVTFRTFSDKRFNHLLRIQIPTIINASHIVAEIFHDDGMHTCEFKTLNFSNPTDPAWVASMLRMTYDDSLSQSSSKNITCHFNSSQITIAERYALTQYFKNTRLVHTRNILISSTLL